MADALTPELRAACFSAARAAYARWSTRAPKELDDALRCAVNAALLEALPALLEAGAQAERKAIVSRAQRLNYGPTLRRFIRDVVREYHLTEGI